VEISIWRRRELDLGAIPASASRPNRPQERIDLPALKDRFHELLHQPIAENGYNKPESEDQQRFVVNTGVNGNHTPHLATPSGHPAPGARLPLMGGGDQDPATMPEPVHNQVSVKDTSTETEVEMMQNRPTP